MKALFDDAKSFYDANVVNETRNQTYERLSKIGGSVGLDEKKMLKLLWINDKPDKDGSLNTGNGVTSMYCQGKSVAPFSPEIGLATRDAFFLSYTFSSEVEIC
jgi:hypothetical protein